MRPYGKPKQLEKRRQKAIAMLKAGKTYREVAKTLKASLSSVVRWHQGYEKKGAEGLLAKPVPGRPPWLTKRQKKQLVRLLLKGPQKSGFPTELWTLGRVAKVIKKRFGVRYSMMGTWKLLRTGLELSWQKPEWRARTNMQRITVRGHKKPVPAKTQPFLFCSSFKLLK